MKKIILLLLIPLFFSCDDDSKDKFPSSTYDDYNSILNIYFLGYKLNDYSGFELHPLIDGLDFTKEHTITSNGLSVTIKNGIISGDYELMNEIQTYGPCISQVVSQSPNGYDDKIYLSGLKNGNIWIGLFNIETKEQLNEWITDDFEKEFILDFGYGDIEEIYITNIGGSIVYQDDDNLFIHTYTFAENSSITFGLYLIKENKIVRVSLDIYPTYTYNFLGITEFLYKWHNDSFLFNYGYYSPYNRSYIIYPNGQTLKSDSYIDINYNELFPISYTEWIVINFYGNLRITYYSYDNGQIKSTYSDNFKELYQSDMRTEYSLIGEENELFEFRIDITYYSGEKTSFTFKIDREGNFFT